MENEINIHQQKNRTKFTVVKAILMTLFIAVFNIEVVAQDSIELSDIEILHDTNWEGNLMYIDYTSGNKTVLQTKMQLVVKGNRIMISTQYNNEPKANSKGSIKLKKGGTYFGNEKVIKKIKQKNGMIKIVTMFKGSDNNKKATIYKTYLFDDNIYSVTKEILLTGSKEKFIRNKYSYTRI